MPTLIRLLVILLVLAGLVYGAMLALVLTVQPGDKEITIRIPARDLMPSPERDPLVRREIDTSRPVEAAPPADAEPAAAVEPAAEEATAISTPTSENAPREDAVTEMPPPETTADDDGSIVTLAPGTE